MSISPDRFSTTVASSNPVSLLALCTDRVCQSVQYRKLPATVIPYGCGTDVTRIRLYCPFKSAHSITCKEMRHSINLKYLKRILKKIAVTSHDFVKSLVLFVSDFDWLCPWFKAMVDPSLPAFYSSSCIMIKSEFPGLGLVPILYLVVVRLPQE